MLVFESDLCFYLLHFGASLVNCLTWLVEDGFLTDLSFCSLVMRSVGVGLVVGHSAHHTLFFIFASTSVQ